MTKPYPRLLAGTAVLALSVGLGVIAPGSAQANQSSGVPGAKTSATHRTDDRPGPLSKKQDRLREKALALLDSGDATLKQRAAGGATVKLQRGPDGAQAAPSATDYFEFPVNRTDKIFTVLAEFGGTGPLHNQIPEPDRTTDNSTYWVPDFNEVHFDELFNGSGDSFTNYYHALSGGRYDVTSTVEDWVQVPGDAATYGANDVEDDGGSWQFIADSVDAWYAAQVAAGTSQADIDAYLATLDQWDRYDWDDDGDFNEPDGYIDHFQAVHAGEGEEAGGGAQGADAIWSHRWYVDIGYGTAGPTVGDTQNKLGGTQIGDSGYWIGDYTVEPENGGLGVFAHEYGHDLGLPDYYDTNGGENGTAFWTLMSSGSWLSHGAADQAIGTTPGLMGPEEKYELGWLDYSEVGRGQTATVNLGPSQNTYDDPKTQANEADQAVKVPLPDKTTITPYVTPAGGHAWWSGRGDDLDQRLTRTIAGAGNVTVTASAWYEIEAGYDYLYGEYSTDGGATWNQAGSPVTGDSRGSWKTLRYSYKASGPSQFRFRYDTDGGVNEAGAFLDDITVKSVDGTFTDTVENGNQGWTTQPVEGGWKISTGTETDITQRYYLIENRQYVGYDATLGEGPYQYCCQYSKPNWVELFQFRPGMLVWLVDHGFADNNTSVHPGGGAALPVDARPAPFGYGDGTFPSNRRQPFDAAFGLETVPRTCLHKEVLVGKGKNETVQTLEACAAQAAGIATFDDSDPLRYWSAADPQNSVKVAGAGVTATVTGGSGGFLTVEVQGALP